MVKYILIVSIAAGVGVGVGVGAGAGLGAGGVITISGWAMSSAPQALRTAAAAVA